MRRFSCAVLVLTAALGAGAPSAAARSAVSSRHGAVGAVRVDGAVGEPRTYSRAQLQALPQVGVPDQRSSRPGTISGVLLTELVDASAPTLPAGKNPQLRVVVTVAGRLGSTTFAFGELDPGFGNHPALLALRYDGRPLPGAPYLAVPGDEGYRRTVVTVTSVTVGVVAATVPVGVPAGSIVVAAGRRAVTLEPRTVAALPRTTVTVTFSAAGTPQTHTETGPTLAAVLRAAHVRTTPSSVVTAVGSDGYAAAVTLAEATSGRRPLLLSTVEDGAPLAQPRLVAVGDVKGGRDVSGVVELTVGTSSTR